MWWILTQALANPSSAYTTLEGERPTKELVTAVKSRRADYEQCFKGAEAVKMQIVVSPGGQVSDARFSMTDVDQQVASCITRASLKLRFAPSTDSTPTTYQWLATRASLDENFRGTRPDIGDLHVKGGLTKDQVREVMDRNKSHLSYCFRRDAAADHALKRATLDLHLGVDAEGKIVSARGMYSDHGEAFAECVAKRAMQLSFDRPSSDGITEIVYPLEFTK